MSTARELFARNMELVQSGRIEEWVDLFAEDAVLEFPFPPPGMPTRLQGKAALFEHMKTFPENLRVRFDTPVYYDTADPNLVIADFTSEGTALATGRTFRQSYLSIVWVHDGKIVRYRDFWDPWVMVQALGGAEGIAEALRDN